MASWSTLQLRGIEDYVAPVETAVNTATTAIDTINTVISVTVSVLRTVSNILIDEITLETVAVKSLVAAINNIIDSFTGLAGAHILNVPLQKGTNESISNIIIDSLRDAKDPFKPMYNQSDYVAGLMILYGVTNENIATLISQLLTLQNLFGEFTTGLDRYEIPAPTNLRAKIITTPRIDYNDVAYDDVVSLDTLTSQDGITVTTTGFEVRTFGRVRNIRRGPVSIHLQWDPSPASNFLNSLDADITLDTINVYKSTSALPEVPAGGFQPKANLPTPIESYSYNAIHEALATFVDDDIDEEDDSKLVYYVGYEMSCNGIDLGVVSLSDAVTIDVQRELNKGLTQDARGTPPNWQAVVNPLALIPGFETLIQEIKEVVASLEGFVEGSATALKEFITFLEALAEKNLQATARLLAVIQQLLIIIKSVNIAASVYSFAGTGGTGLIRQEVSSALNDTSVENRPQFDNPSSNGLIIPPSDSPFSLGAIMLVAGAGTAADITAATTLFNLFGAESNVGRLDELIGAGLLDVKSSIRDAIAAISNDSDFTASLEFNSGDSTLVTDDFSTLATAEPLTSNNDPDFEELDDYRAGTSEDVTTNPC